MILEVEWGNHVKAGKKVEGTPPFFLSSFIEAVKCAAHKREMQCVVVGVSRGSFWTGLLTQQLAADMSGIADRFAMLGYYVEPGCTPENVLQQGTAARAPVMCIASTQYS